jgi:hypothetical protein
MADADQRQIAPCNEVDPTIESTPAAVSRANPWRTLSMRSIVTVNRKLLWRRHFGSPDLPVRYHRHMSVIGSRRWSKYMQSKWSTKVPVECSFNRMPAMARVDRSGLRRMAVAAFVAAIAWFATARADDALDRGVVYHISPSLLASALIDASPLPDIPDVTVAAPRPPAEQELAGDSLAQFVAHHATTHYVDTDTAGNLARWRGGKQSICPLTVGLSPGFNAYVTARLRALAAYVGAPGQLDPQCKANVQILFTDKPQEKMDDIIKWATTYFRNRYSGGMRDLIAFRSDHAIQGWYMTTSGGGIVLTTDVSLVGLDVQPVWPQITQHYIASSATGTRLGAVSGSGSGIGIVILVVDTTKVAGATIGTISDYLAMLTLSVAQSPDHCDPLPSILDLMSSSCGAREMPKAITAGDLAFLKALYYRNTGLRSSMSRNEIQANMIQQFKGH